MLHKGWRRLPGADVGGYFCRKAYELVTPITVPGVGEVRHVVADFSVTPDRGPETMLFKADVHGIVTNWQELWCVYRDAVTDDSAITDLVMFYRDDETYGSLREIMKGGGAE